MSNNAKQYEEDLEKIKRLRPIDDDFMRVIFKDNIPLAETVLRKILDKPDLVVTKLEIQRDLKRLAGSRAICLDAFCTDSE